MPVRRSRTLPGLLMLALVCVSACSGPDPEYGFDGVCRGNVTPLSVELRSDTAIRNLQWTPDGSQIVFEYSEGFTHARSVLDAADIYAVHVSGNEVNEVLDLPSRNLAHGIGRMRTMFDLSPDRARFAVATCAISEESLLIRGTEMQVYSYEIFVSDVDGNIGKRLTNNTYFDVLPAWSPDGEYLAFISDPDRSVFSREHNLTGRGPDTFYTATTRLTVHEIATGETREIGLPAGYAVAPVRLEWSPSGDRIAFVALEGERSPWNHAVYTVGADGSGLTRVSDAVSGPTWSPDGESIAMIVDEGDDGLALYIFAADGSNVVKEKYGHGTGVNRFRGRKGAFFVGAYRLGWEHYWYGNLSWSPDGSAILLDNLSAIRSGPAVVQLGTAGVEAGASREYDAQTHAFTGGAGGSILASPLTTGWPSFYYLSAWSPDGAQIAMRIDSSYQSFRLRVVDRDGNSRALVDWERD